MNVIEAIRSKRAVRVFRDESLPGEVTRKILNAGRRAQSSKNTQPWHFIAIRDKETLAGLAATSSNIAFLAGSALTVALVTTHPSVKETILFDAGQAAANMQLAAWELGVVSCLGTVYELDQARAVLGFPADRHLHIAVGFGYPLPTDAEPRKSHRGGRRSLDDVVHWEHW